MTFSLQMRKLVKQIVLTAQLISGQAGFKPKSLTPKGYTLNYDANPSPNNPKHQCCATQGQRLCRRHLIFASRQLHEQALALFYRSGKGIRKHLAQRHKCQHWTSDSDLKLKVWIISMFKCMPFVSEQKTTKSRGY